MSLYISLTILRGEADLYVDIDNKVGKNHNAYKSEHVGSDVVFINGFEQRHLRRCAKHDDKSFPGARGSICEYFVAVVGKPGARSRRAAAGRAELLANFFGGAVWGVFRENANCGDPPG